MKRLVLAAVVLATIAGTLTQACAGTLEATAGVSTLGEGIGLAAPLSPGVLNLEVGFNHYAKDRSGVYTDNSGDTIPYTVSGRLQSIPVLLNFYPFHGVFRLTGGVVYDQNQLNAVGDGSSYTFNGVSYPAATVGTVTANVRFRRYAPYLGLGFGDTLNGSGLSAGFDVGVLFQGSPQITLHASNSTSNPTLAQNVASAQAQANQKASSDKYYPVVGLHLGYTF